MQSAWLNAPHRPLCPSRTRSTRTSAATRARPCWPAAIPLAEECYEKGPQGHRKEIRQKGAAKWPRPSSGKRERGFDQLVRSPFCSLFSSSACGGTGSSCRPACSPTPVQALAGTHRPHTEMAFSATTVCDARAGRRPACQSRVTRLPPPVITMPLVEMSATSSGGVRFQHGVDGLHECARPAPQRPPSSRWRTR